MHEQKYYFYCQICQFVGFLLPSSSRLLKLPSLAPREELIVFTYQLWKQQFLSVVQLQFPFDNCHSPFSPTTFFEIYEIHIELQLLMKRKVTGSNPVEVLIFFRLLPSNCLRRKIDCDDHSSLSKRIIMAFLFAWIKMKKQTKHVLGKRLS